MSYIEQKIKVKERIKIRRILYGMNFTAGRQKKFVVVVVVVNGRDNLSKILFEKI